MSIHHAYPVNDSRPHDVENGGSCECGPKVEFLDNGNITVVHNAWDGREIIEEIENSGANPMDGKS
jgi:hypothetical protein